MDPLAVKLLDNQLYMQLKDSLLRLCIQSSFLWISKYLINFKPCFYGNCKMKVLSQTTRHSKKSGPLLWAKLSFLSAFLLNLLSALTHFTQKVFCFPCQFCLFVCLFFCFSHYLSLCLFSLSFSFSLKPFLVRFWFN